MIERVKLPELDAWKREHDLVYHRTAFCGKPGFRPTADGAMRWSGLGRLPLYWPREWVEGEVG